MKNKLTVFTIAILLGYFASGQTPARRSVRYHNLGKDSVNLSFNEEYLLIEDSCTTITRYGHLNFKTRKFYGPFKDSSNNDILVAEGNYNLGGLKDGTFITHYLNGNLQARVNYKEDKFTGDCSFFYENGKPKLDFHADGNEITIMDGWDEKGKKIIEKGNGNYSVDLGSIAWSGKLNNGKPTGTWKAVRTNDRTNTVLVKEVFKDGKFEKGSGIAGDYSDSSRIILVSDAGLPFLNAERMRVSMVPCNGVKRKKFVNAQYRDGLQVFSEKIKELVTPFLGTVNLKPYDTELELFGEISEKGEISRLSYTNNFDDKIASGLVRELGKLPYLEPALADGKPVKQKIIFTFKFMSGIYRYSFRFVPLNLN